MKSSPLSTCLDLLSLAHSVKLRLADIAEQYEMTGVQLSVLYAISENPVTMGGVAHKLHCDASNATGIIDRLVALGLVTRRECAEDRRSKLLEVTVRGKAVIREIRASLPEQLGCSRLSDAECGVIRSLVAKFAVD